MRHGAARYGEAWCGEVRLGLAGSGKAWSGAVREGLVWHGKAWLGLGRFGKARHGVVRQGMDARTANEGLSKMATETQQLLELKDYTDKLFRKEESRGDVMFDEGSGMHKASSRRFRLLHLPTCVDCPQYGERLVYARKCYYEPMCGWPAFIGIPIVKLKVKLKRMRAEAKIASAYRRLGWKM